MAVRRLQASSSGGGSVRTLQSPIAVSKPGSPPSGLCGDSVLIHVVLQLSLTTQLGASRHQIPQCQASDQTAGPTKTALLEYSCRGVLKSKWNRGALPRLAKGIESVEHTTTTSPAPPHHLPHTIPFPTYHVARQNRSCGSCPAARSCLAAALAPAGAVRCPRCAVLLQGSAAHGPRTLRATLSAA